MHQIDKGIPLPAVRRSRKYPFDKMEVGDSFFAEVAQGIAAVAARDYRMRINNGHKKFTTRKVEGGTRVWRVE